MIKLFIVFFVFFMIFWFVIPNLYKMKTSEKIKLTRLILYSILCSVATIATMTLIVFLF